MAGSISLIGFGADSVIEVSSSIAALWRLRADADLVRRARVEVVTLRLIGLSFLGLTLYILIDAGHALYLREAPEKTVPGIFIAAASVVWWADPVAALCMTPIIAKEGVEGLRGKDHCDDYG